MQRLSFVYFKQHILLGFLLISIAAYSQTQTPLDIELAKAQRAFDYKKYNTAAGLFQKAFPKIKTEEKQDSVLFMIAESYRLSNNYTEAIKWYEKLVNTKYPNPRIIYSYGLLLKNFEQYEEASRKFYDYLFENPDDENGKREQMACKIAIEWKNNPEKFTISNLSELNTIYSDYAPAYSPTKLIWASSRTEATGSEIFEWTGQKCSDFFESEKSGDQFSSFKKLKGNVNTNFNEGSASVDTAYTTLFFTQCNGRDGKSPGCKIYVSYQNDTGWSTPEILPFNSDSFSCGHPSMQYDGKRLFFASDMPGGYGQKDIYYVDYNRNKNTWGKPINLGPNINTDDDDMFPFVDEKGHLYFATKGRLGMGGLDIFYSQLMGDKYTQAQNLKYPINSGGDDFGISYVPEKLRNAKEPIAYFSSNRQGGKGDDDLYSISIKPYSFVVKTKVVDASTRAVIASADIIITDSTDTQLLKLRSGNEGTANADLPLNQRLFIKAEKEKYLSNLPVEISTYNITADSVVTLEIPLQLIPEEDYEFTLQGIYYDLDKYDLRPESKIILDSVAKILENNPKILIELAAHTDSRAPADYNMTLSQKRAESCVNYLISKGIKKERLLAKGYGETQLVNDCADDVECSEEEHQQNRRTTIRITGTNFKAPNRK
jgi:outer membrane protein OmpA-like peptidoglycan-associated protein